ncbi:MULTISPECIES: metallophosphoesterase [unclassified Meiothermus]|uniref:metallophosphoesterase family protein n=1 Tax=unclassified Meiothermus TaxID=370471 RepID=UPI000D7CA943|nr:MULTISPECIES: metallophosphoesterase family protein [unclassified Meiothermus]PZA08406.1 metallophosphoesterase [Meiothermus sp. Pnk-1]RYM37073.1 metallophosphoesterase [Meiothermus sp. PNK-Is4]
MRIAVFSDVHGNRFALEAVLEDIQSHHPDALVNLGDQVWGAADPAGAWRLQQSLGAITVRGNTDEFLSKTGPYAELADWLKGQLEPEAPQRLRGFPVTAEVAEGEVVVAHGSLHNPSEALFLRFEGGQSYNASPREMLEQARAFPKARVIVVGHTHREMLQVLEGITFVNAGPVSRQFDGLPLARWVLLEKRGSGWTVAFRRVEYDVEAAARWALEHAPIGEAEAAHLRSGIPR